MTQSNIYVESKLRVGEIVRHQKFDYRGVIVDVDPVFSLSEEWYEQVARSRPPKDKPWYRVLVHGGQHETYVAERHLASDESGDPIDHPALVEFFDELKDGVYCRTRYLN
jgi:heat shock protein HspQ